MAQAPIPTEQFETAWTNYGDVNPEPHGGRFVRWDADDEMWEIVETTRADAAMPNGSEDTQIVMEAYIEPQDVWVNGEPSEGFTDDMARILESLHENGGLRGASPEPDSPRFFERAAYYVADMTHYVGGHTTFEEDVDNYDELVASYGVNSYND